MKKIESLLLLSCRSPFLYDSKIYAPMANLYLKSYINQHLPEVNVVLGDDDYEIASEPVKDEGGNELKNAEGTIIRKHKLNENGHHVLDSKTESLFEKFDAIGLSIMTPQREEAHAILKSIKERWPEKIVIAGGPHVKHYVGDIIKADEPYDYLVPLDGEKVLTGILSGQTSKFPNRYMRTGIINGKNQILEDIEDPRILVDVMGKTDIANAPRPDRTSENAKKVIKNYNYRLGDRESTTMMTARGCPEHCKFCEDARTAVKWSSLENIKKELGDIKNMGYGGVYLFDDLFAIAKDKVEPICKELKKRNLIYRCNAQARYFTMWGEDFAKLLADTGCYEIAFGAETGSQKILDAIEKRTTIEMNYKTVEYANKNRIIVKAFILLGLPGEDEDTLKDTEKFIQYLISSNPNNDFGAYIFYPYKGTQLRDSLDRGEDIGLQMLVPEGVGTYCGGLESVIRTPKLTENDLLEFRDYLIKKYRPTSNKPVWDKFRDTHLASNVEYSKN